MGKPSSDNAKHYKISQTKFHSNGSKKFIHNANELYLSFFHDLIYFLSPDLYSLTLRYQSGIVYFLLSKELTFVFIPSFCQRDCHKRANTIINNNDSSGEDDNDDKRRDEGEDDDDTRGEEDDDDDIRKETTTMPHPRRPLGKAAQKALQFAEREKKRSMMTTTNEGLPPPLAQSTPKSAGGMKKAATMVPSLVVTATSTSRAVITNTTTTKKRKKEENGTVVLPSGVSITWEPEGVSVEVGEPYPPPQRRSRRDLVDRVVGPTSGCGPRRGHGSADSITAPIVHPPTPTRCEILAPYLVPTMPKRKKPRANMAETAPDPDAPTAPANNIEQPAPEFISVDDILPSFPPSKREVQR